jgi:hypothetical protein
MMGYSRWYLAEPGKLEGMKKERPRLAPGRVGGCCSCRRSQGPLLCSRLSAGVEQIGVLDAAELVEDPLVCCTCGQLHALVLHQHHPGVP